MRTVQIPSGLRHLSVFQEVAVAGQARTPRLPPSEGRTRGGLRPRTVGRLRHRHGALSGSPVLCSAICWTTVHGRRRSTESGRGSLPRHRVPASKRWSCRRVKFFRLGQYGVKARRLDGGLRRSHGCYSLKPMACASGLTSTCLCCSAKTATSHYG